MKPTQIRVLEQALAVRRRLARVGRRRDVSSHFGPGGIDEAERRCAEANRDLLAFIRPPPGLAVSGLHVSEVRRARQGLPYRTVTYDSPLPSGEPSNDRVRVRLLLPERWESASRVVVFHHPVYQRRWTPWEWFLRDLRAVVPVAIMAAPYHFERTPHGEFSGDGTMNANPWRLFLAIRQWAWDQAALGDALGKGCGLESSATVGYSLGAFQALLAACAGALAPRVLVAIAPTNHYVHGLLHGVMGSPILESMRRAGLDPDRLRRMADSIELARYAFRLRGRPLLVVRGEYDPVEPPPSIERLEAALAPSRSVRLPAGHATLLAYRKTVLRETISFLEEHRAI